MPMNMSHCRFENTLLALRECEQYLSENWRARDPFAELSAGEEAAARKLFKLCRAIADDYGDEL